MMLTGKTIKAAKAKKLGLVDKVVEALGIFLFLLEFFSSPYVTLPFIVHGADRK